MKRALILLTVNVALFCVLAELVGLAAFYYEHGWLFYLDPYREPYQGVPGDAREQALTDVGLRPYFGPIHRPGSVLDIPAELRETPQSPARVQANNFGFASTHDYPVVKSGDAQF